jgi:hypothetical protein
MTMQAIAFKTFCLFSFYPVIPVRKITGLWYDIFLFDVLLSEKNIILYVFLESNR